jgi:hypothetical protein
VFSALGGESLIRTRSEVRLFVRPHSSPFQTGFSYAQKWDNVFITNNLRPYFMVSADVEYHQQGGFQGGFQGGLGWIWLV